MRRTHADLYFDLDGTLVEYDATFSTVYETALDRLGVEPSDEAVFSETFFEVVGDVDDPFATAIEATDVDVDSMAFSDSIVAAEIEHVRQKPGAVEVLETLSGRVRLGVLTNGVGRAQRGKLEAAGLSPYVDTVVVASEVDAWKPDPEIYRIAEDRLPGESYAFVADDLERDLLPALERGWHGIYLDSDSMAEHGGRSAGDTALTVADAPGTLEPIADLRELRVGPHH